MARITSSPWLLMHKEANENPFANPSGPYLDPGPHIDFGLSTFGLGKTKGHITYWATEIHLEEDQELLFKIHSLSGQLAISIDERIVLSKKSKDLPKTLDTSITLNKGIHYLCISLKKISEVSKIEVSIEPSTHLRKITSQMHPIAFCPPTLD